MELKPCPFCGAQPYIEEGYKRETWSVECENTDCLIMPGTDVYDTKEEAIVAWNKRAENKKEPRCTCGSKKMGILNAPVKGFRCPDCGNLR